jgi:hypothetical protein
MVGRPSDYLASFPDADLDTYNLGLVSKKKKRIKKMPDVNFAHQIGNQFIDKLKLDFGACLNIREEIHFNDYLFLESGWIDPGEKIIIDGIVNINLEQVFK